MVKKVLIPVVVFLFCTGAFGADAYYYYLEEPTSTRSLAMGTAGSSVSGSGGFAFHNPALPSLNRPYVSLEFGRLYEDLNRGFLEFCYKFPQWFFGVSLQSQSIDFTYADERGVMTGSEGSEQGLTGSVAAGIIKQQLSAGVSVNWMHHRISDDYSNGISFSAGAIYQIIPDKLNAGASILHFYGRNTGLLDSTKNYRGDPLPVTAKAGASWSDTIKSKVPYTVSADIVYSFNYEKLMVPVGVEAWILPALAIRVGKRINHPTDLMSMGAGLKLANLKYDVAFTPIRFVSDLGMKWSMALTYELPFFRSKQKSRKVSDTTDVNTMNDKKSSGPLVIEESTVPVTGNISVQGGTFVDSTSVHDDTASVIDSTSDIKKIISEMPDNIDSVDTIIEMNAPAENNSLSDSVTLEKSINKFKEATEIPETGNETSISEEMLPAIKEETSEEKSSLEGADTLKTE